MDCSQFELECIIELVNQQTRNKWELARFIGSFALMPWIENGSNLSLSEIYPFAWEKQEQQLLTKEELIIVQQQALKMYRESQNLKQTVVSTSKDIN